MLWFEELFEGKKSRIFGCDNSEKTIIFFVLTCDMMRFVSMMCFAVIKRRLFQSEPPFSFLLCPGAPHISECISVYYLICPLHISATWRLRGKRDKPRYPITLTLTPCRSPRSRITTSPSTLALLFSLHSPLIFVAWWKLSATVTVRLFSTFCSV